jgi:predicted small metal-binding protein
LTEVKTVRVLRCKDVGYDCPFEAHGETMREVLQIMEEHGKKIHAIKAEWFY